MGRQPGGVEIWGFSPSPTWGWDQGTSVQLQRIRVDAQGSGNCGGGVRLDQIQIRSNLFNFHKRESQVTEIFHEYNMRWLVGNC